MSRVRSDQCFRFEISDVQGAVVNGWASGSVTWTLGIEKHVHYYRRIGNAERGWLILEYDTVFHGHQTMQLKFETVPAGFGGHRLAWCCPIVGCNRRVKTLFRPHGGAYFLCRHCWDVRYASQYETPSEKFWRRYNELEDEFRELDTSSKRWRQVANQFLPMSRALLSSSDENNRRMQVRLDRLTRKPRERGRPNKRKERERLRAARAAENAVRPKRPPGRPKEKRAYLRRSPLALSERRDEMQAYCPRCRDRRDMLRPKPVTFRNGRRAMQGKCAVCDATMARIVKREGTLQGEGTDRGDARNRCKIHSADRRD